MEKEKSVVWVQRLVVWILLFNLSVLFGVNISPKNVILTPYTSYAVDETQSWNLAYLKKNPNLFRSLTQKKADFGFTKATIWLKLQLDNSSSQTLSRYVINKEHLLNQITFFYKDKVEDGGLIPSHKSSLVQPSIKVVLEAKSSATLYIKITSPTNPVSVELNSLDEEEVYKDAFEEQIFNAIFFGALLILIMYNAILFSLLREKINFYYVGYLLSILFYYLGYTGMDRLYLYRESSELFAYIGVYLITFMVVMVVCFSYEFLGLNQRGRMRKIRNVWLTFLGLIALIMIYKPLYSIAVPAVLGIITILVLLGLALVQLKTDKERAAIYLLGWSPLILMFILMGMKKFFGVSLLDEMFHFEQLAILFEAAVFSFALAKRIQKINQERLEAQSTLIKQQKTVQEALEAEVHKRTVALEERLKERSVLLREVQHRVKNNMQIIISMLRLQSDSHDNAFKALMLTAENRIRSMLSVHELLYRHEDISSIDLQVYFKTLIEDIALALAFDKEAISFSMQDITATSDRMMHYGFIINELVTNAIRHAQNPQGLKISVTLLADEKSETVSVSDNGSIRTKGVFREGLGLTLVRTIVIDQLGGELRQIEANGITMEAVFFK